MANSGSSVDEDEDDVPAAARLPTQVRMNNSPFRKFTKTKRKSSKSNHGGKNKSNDERTGTVPVAKKTPKNRSHRVPVYYSCLLYTSPSPRDKRQSRMPSSA